MVFLLFPINQNPPYTPAPHKPTQSLNPINGKISGSAAKTELVKSKLPNQVLGKIWKLSDIDQDGQLDMDEFALSMHLVSLKLDGHEIPSELPLHLVPPSKVGINNPNCDY